MSAPHPSSIATIRHERVTANGLGFHVAQCGEGPHLALCLHGFPESSYSWRHQLPLLARLGHRAWAPDLRGYGASEKPPRVADYAIEHLLDDVAGLVDASGAERVTLIGHDWGAIIAWYAAIRRVRDFDRLVILNVPHPGAGRAGFRRPAQWLRSLYALFFQIPRLPEWVLGRGDGRPLAESLRRMAVHPENFTDEAIEATRAAIMQPGARTAALNYYRALVRGGGMRRQHRLGLPVIETPTLMLWGVRDVALTIQTTYGTERWVRDLTLRYLPDASHFVQQDAPELVNEMLEAWLGGRPVPVAPGAERLPGPAGSASLAAK
jgi:pimeloyl-ACP methyl ester carboxylesterase